MRMFFHLTTNEKRAKVARGQTAAEQSASRHRPLLKKMQAQRTNNQAAGQSVCRHIHSGPSEDKGPSID